MTEVKKSKIPYFFFVFFAVIFAVDFFYIYLAKKNWRGLATEDAYQKGLHYNNVIANANKQKELGWEMKISYKNLQNKSGELEIFLFDKNNQKISDVSVVVNFKRPIQEGKDFSRELKFFGTSYKTKIDFPFAGQWDFIISASKGSDNYQETKRYVVQ